MSGDVPCVSIPEPGTRIRVLSLRQPWASLVACGAKRFETRSWRPPETLLGQRILIHASKGWSTDERALAKRSPFAPALESAQLDPATLPCGVLLAVATLSAFYATESPTLKGWVNELPNERFFGDYRDERFAWLLSDVQPIEPIAARGMLGLWEWTVPECGLAPLTNRLIG